MHAFIDAEKATYGVAPICRVLQIVPSGYRMHRRRLEEPDRRSASARRDETLRTDIQHVWAANWRVDSVRSG